MQAIKNIDSIDQSQLLGYMMFYHIPDIKVSHDELKAIFKANSMDESLLPPKIYEHDAFRRATGTVKGTIAISTLTGSTNARLNIDEVRNNHDEIVRVVGRKAIDDLAAEVSYEPVAKFIFDKNIKSATYDINMTSGTDTEFDYKTLLEDTLNLYKEWVTYHSRETVRNIVNKIVKSTQPVSIIKGAHFIPKQEYDTLKGLQGIIKDLALYTQGEVPEIEVIPLLDTVQQRSMIEKRVNNEIMSEIDGVMSELAEMLKDDRDIHTRTIKRITSQFQDLKEKTEVYSTLLETKMLTVQQQLLTAIDKFTAMKVKAEEDKEVDLEENDTEVI